MNYESLEYKPKITEVGVYECEITLKFNLIEEKGVLLDQEHLLEILLDAFICGSDEYMEPIHTIAKAKAISEVEAPPQMRRQLIRLRNSRELAS